ncbi:glutathione S-transferase family protein [Halopseudomonas salina]|uniref:Glutathione S-transferase n=1 Tax=Halopseudomonas salina TaxID=1323744 RepID=A0ABQ1P1V2_9GAMM|nr:glutathione S-transferase family protein [Halopseudomonas salina]GGC89371.1 glutathione S-transferase [Halopseudomonas salina]
MITLHHLNQSRSKRIIWMLEELGVEYQLVSYQRDKVTRRAPEALKAINPLGRSPVIEDGDLVICESGAIIDYLVSRYGADIFAPPANTPAHARYVQWLHFAEGTAAFPLIALYLLSADNSQKCFLGGFCKEQMTDVLTLANTELTDKTYLMGDQFTGADVLNSFVFEKIGETRGLGEYPNLEVYMQRIMARPAAQKAEALEREYDAEVS